MEEIILGETVCFKLKAIYFAEMKWQDCYNEVAAKFTLFKRIMRKIYPEKDIKEIFKSIHTFDTLDIQEIFSMEEDYLNGGSVEESVSYVPKYDQKVIWIPVSISRPSLVAEIRKMVA